jgi:hypothetical protein
MTISPSLPPPGLTGRVAPGEPLGRRCWRTASRALSGYRPSRELAELAEEIARPLTTGRRIAVVSARGGAGKSAVAALLGSVFAARRHDAVLAADADPDGGSLGWRLGFGGGPTLDLVAPQLLVGGAAARHLPHTRTGLWYLPGGSARPGLARDVTRALTRSFAVCITDCAGTGAPATAAVLAEPTGWSSSVRPPRTAFAARAPPSTACPSRPAAGPSSRSTPCTGRPGRPAGPRGAGRARALRRPGPAAALRPPRRRRRHPRPRPCRRIHPGGGQQARGGRAGRGPAAVTGGDGG